MSMFTAKTRALFALAALLFLLNLLPSSQAELAVALPTLSALDKDAATRVEISKGQTEKMVLNKGANGWEILQPLQGPADAVSIRSLLTVFRDPVSMDLKVDEGNLETYLLDDQNGVLLEIFTGQDTPAISVVVGGDAPGGTSFVRLKDSDVVYRAKVGSRARLDRDFEDWRNRMVVLEEAKSVTDIEIRRAGDTLRFTRAAALAMSDDDEATPGPWSYEEDPSFSPDQNTLNDLVASLTTLRAGRLLNSDFDGGFEPPAAIVTLTLQDGRVITLRFGTRDGEDGAYLRRDDAPGAYVVGGSRKEAVLRPLSAYRDLEIFHFDRTNIDTIRLVDSLVPTTLHQLPDGLWEVTEPARMDADVKVIFFAVNTLATLRGDRLAEPGESTGIDKPTMSLTIRLKSGDTEVLEVGARASDDQGRIFYAVRRVGSDRVYWLRDSTLARVRQGFNRAD